MEDRKIKYIGDKLFGYGTVIMLPTNKSLRKGDLAIGSLGNLTLLTKITPTTKEFYTPQHLYITTNELPEAGEWYIDDANQVRKSITSDIDYWSVRTDYLKVIASTDESLGVPKISKSFLKTYCKGGGIDNVLVGLENTEWFNEVEQKGWRPYPDSKTTTRRNRVSINSNDNTIIIKRLKDSWTKAELYAEIEDKYFSLKDRFLLRGLIDGLC